MSSEKLLIDEVCKALEDVRKTSPLIHCMTNTVVTGFTANCLLALGAAPAMIYDEEECGIFAGVASALLVNVGTITKDQAVAMRAAVTSANQAKRPWVLDPVAVGALPLRTNLAKELKLKTPSMIRGNASEIIALAGGAATGRGVDSTAGVDEAVEAARALSKETGAVVLVTGAIDKVVYGDDSVISIANGSPLMTRVTGVGCSQGAVAGAFLAVCEDRKVAAVATALVMAIAGDIAAEQTSSPGSYQIALLDALDKVSSNDIRVRAKVEICS